MYDPREEFLTLLRQVYTEAGSPATTRVQDATRSIDQDRQGLGKSSVHRYLNGKSLPSERQIRLLLDALAKIMATSGRGAGNTISGEMRDRIYTARRQCEAARIAPKADLQAEPLDLAAAMIENARLLAGRMLPGEAEEAVLVAVNLYRGIVNSGQGANSDQLGVAYPGLADALEIYAQCLFDQDRTTEAASAMSEALMLRKVMFHASPSDYLADRYAESLINMGIALSEDGRRGEGAALMTQAVSVLERREDPNDISNRPKQAYALSQASIMTYNAGEVPAALELASLALGIYAHMPEAVRRSNREEEIKALYSMGVLLRASGRPADSLPAFKAAETLALELPDNPTLPLIRQHLNQLRRIGVTIDDSQDARLSSDQLGRHQDTE
jgi:tetratricopeptide (TPR) repeat protein